MARIPDTDAAFLTFARERANIWAGGQGGPPVIGLSAQQIADTEAATAAAEAADEAARNARNISKAATVAKRAAFAALEQVIGADIDTIDAFAKATKDPLVYQKAQIDPPKEPSERDAPPAPVIGEVVLASGGTVRVPFTVVSGGGAQYQVQRRDTRLDNTSTDWFPVATITEKTYDDQAIPFGLREVQYRVRAQLSSGPASPWSGAYTFSFGSVGSQAGPAASSDAA